MYSAAQSACKTNSQCFCFFFPKPRPPPLGEPVSQVRSRLGSLPFHLPHHRGETVVPGAAVCVVSQPLTETRIQAFSMTLAASPFATSGKNDSSDSGLRMSSPCHLRGRCHTVDAALQSENGCPDFPPGLCAVKVMMFVNMWARWRLAHRKGFQRLCLR